MTDVVSQGNSITCQFHTISSFTKIFSTSCVVWTDCIDKPIMEAMRLALGCGILFVPSVEISTNRIGHIVCYWDWKAYARGFPVDQAIACPMCRFVSEKRAFYRPLSRWVEVGVALTHGHAHDTNVRPLIGTDREHPIIIEDDVEVPNRSWDLQRRVLPHSLAVRTGRSRIWLGSRGHIPYDWARNYFYREGILGFVEGDILSPYRRRHTRSRR